MAISPIIYIKVTNLLVYNRYWIQWKTIDPNITKFEIYRSNSPTSGFEKVGEVSRNQFDFIDQVSFNFHQVYYYKVTQTNQNNETSSLDDAIAGSDRTFTTFDETPFIKYPLDSDRVIGEVPGGIKDGVNTVFQTSNTFKANSLIVYLNGVRQTLGKDYIENSDLHSFTFLSIIPINEDDLIVDYLKLN